MSYSVPPPTDPIDPFAHHLWLEYFEKTRMLDGRDMVDDVIRARALARMRGDSPKVSVIGLPHAPDEVVWTAHYENSIDQTGSRYLIGEWLGRPGRIGADFASQRQNWTQIIHWNTGVGWKRIRTSMLQLEQLVLLPVSDARSIGIMNFLRDTGWLESWPDSGNWSNRLGDHSDVIFFESYIEKTRQWKEIVDVLVMARSFAESQGRDLSCLDLFMAYDIASGEGFHVFGIDALDDVIATQAGALFAAEIESGASGVVDEPSLKLSLEGHFRSARADFLAHPLNSDRLRMLDAFLSVHLAVADDDNGRFVPVKIRFPLGSFGAGSAHSSGSDSGSDSGGSSGSEYLIWMSTIGTIVQGNQTAIAREGGDVEFLDAVQAVLEDRSKTELNSSSAVLTTSDVKSLHEIIEVLSLIDEPR